MDDFLLAAGNINHKYIVIMEEDKNGEHSNQIFYRQN